MSPHRRSTVPTEYFKHPDAIVESTTIGRGSRIWAFAHILPRAVIGEDCNICDGVFVENDVVVGNRVTVKSGVQLWDGVRLEDDVFVGPNATFTNDLFPRSRQYLDKAEPTIVRRGASIGANATMLSGITIGERAMVGAGAVVTRPVPAGVIVVGNPARVVGRVHDDPKQSSSTPSTLSTSSAIARPERTAELGRRMPSALSTFTDERGTLSFGEVGRHIPFTPMRFFALGRVAPGATRGNHAHRKCHQFFACLSGSCTITMDDGITTDEFHLSAPAQGVHAPPLTWCTLSNFAPDTILLVLASDVYDERDYIRDFGEFHELAKSHRI